MLVQIIPQIVRPSEMVTITSQQKHGVLLPKEFRYSEKCPNQGLF